MKREMAEFLIHVVGYDSPLGIEYNPMNPYRHFGAPKLVPRLDRPYRFRGGYYETLPQHSRPGVPAMLASRGFTTSVVAPVAVAWPFAMATTAYPQVAGPQYQSAMSGQMNIGSAALNLPKRSDPRDYFKWSYWQGY
jgi:hypothetical protein